MILGQSQLFSAQTNLFRRQQPGLTPEGGADLPVGFVIDADGLAVGALLLVAMGLFGVISGSVLRRRGELAIRLALGATHPGLLRLVVGEGTRLVVLGLILGSPGIYIAGQSLEGLLINMSPFDAPTLAAVAFGLIAVTLSRTNPFGIS